MPSISDLRKRFPNASQGSTDLELLDWYGSQLGVPTPAIAQHYGVKTNAPGFGTAVKGSVGSMVQGVGQLAGDMFPGIINNNNALETYGRNVTQYNPNTVMEGSGSALENIGTNLIERPFNTIGQVAGGAVGFMGPGAVGKVGLGALRAARGVQALEATSGLGKAAGMTGQAAYYGLPSYGQIRDVQESTGNNSFSDKMTAGLASLAIGGIETFAGPEAALARGFKGIGDAGKNFVTTGLKQGAFEASEEMLQNPIEAYARGEDPLSKTNIDQMLAGGVAGFVGGMPMGMAMHPFMKNSRKLANNERLDLLGQPGEFESTDQAASLNAANAFRIPDYIGQQVRVEGMPIQEWIDQQTNVGASSGKSKKDVAAAFNAKLDIPQVVLDANGKPYTTDSVADFFEFQQFGKTNKNKSVKVAGTTETTEAQPIVLDATKTRKEVKAFLDQERSLENITQEQHADATNIIDMAKGQSLAKIRTSVLGIIAPVEVKEELPPVTAEADALLNDIDAKKVIVPAAMTGGLRGIAKANGIVIKKTDTPDSIIGQLRSKRDTATTQKAAEINPTQAATTPKTPVKVGKGGELHIAPTDSTVHEGNLTQAEMTLQDQQAALAENAEPEAVQQFAQTAREQLASALTPKQAQALAAIYGVRNEQDTDWEVVPSTTRAAAKGMGVKHSTVDENAKTGMKKLLKRAKDLGISDEAAIRIMGLQGEAAADVNAISTGQAAQAGLSYRGAATDAPSYRWDEASNVQGDNEELDTTAENYVPEQMNESANTEDVGAPVGEQVQAEVPVDENVIEEDNAPPTEDLSAIDENAAYEVDYDLNKDDMDDAKHVWQQLREAFVAEGVEVPEWKDLSASAFEKFAAATKYHLNHPQGEKSITEMRTAQVEASNAKQATGTNEQAVTGTTKQAEEPNAGTSEKSKPAVSTKKRSRKTEQTVKRSEGSINTEQELGNSDAATISSSLKKLFMSPAKFDSLVSIVQSITDLPLNIAKAAKVTLDDITTQGFVYKGRVYLIADNITPGREQSVLLHELGVHIGMSNILTPAEMKGLAKQIAEWSERNDGSLESKIARATIKRANEANKIALDERGKALTEEIYIEEVAAYFVEEATMAGVDPTAKALAKPNTIQAWINKMVTAFRAAFAKIGMGRFSELSAQDIVDFAYGAANMELTSPTKYSTGGGAKMSYKSTASAAQQRVMADAGNWMARISPKLLALNQLVEQFGDKLRTLKTHAEFTQKMSFLQASLTRDAHALLEKWNSFAVNNKVINGQLMRLMNEASRLGIHPDLAFAHEDNDHLNEKDDLANYNRLKAQYAAMPTEAKTIYQEAKKILANNWKLRKEIFADVVASAYDPLIAKARQNGDEKEAVKLEGKKAKEIADHAKSIKEIRGPYFPLMRFGDYVVKAESNALLDARDELENATGDRYKELAKQIALMEKDPKSYIVEAFESRRERDERMAELSAKGFNAEARLAQDFHQSQVAVTSGAVDKIRDSLHGQFDAKTANKLGTLLTEMYLSAQPEHSALHRQIKRKGVEGASLDMLRAFAEAVERDSFYLSRMKYQKDITSNLFAMKKEADRAGADAQEVYRNVMNRVGADYKYERTPILSAFAKASAIFHLGVAPSFLLTNMSQPWMITVPQLGGVYGFGKTFSAMRTAWGDAAKIIKAGKGGELLNLKDLDLSKLGASAEADMIKYLYEHNKLDLTQLSDMGMLADGIDPRLMKAQKAFGWATHHIEMVNRISTALAAYRLEKARNPSASQEALIGKAIHAVDSTQLDYSSENAAYFMKQGVGFGNLNKVIFQFRKYQQGMLYLMFRNAQQAFKGDKQALGAFSYMMGMQVAMAGVAGLPIYTLLGLFGGGDDEEGDLETRMRNGLTDMVGPDAARVIWKGLPTLLGVDISANIGMGSILKPFPMVSMQDIIDAKTGKEAVSTLLLNGAGAPFGMVASMADGVKLMMDGQWAKGAGKFLPKFLGSPIKAASLATEGLTTRAGNQVMTPDQFDAWDIMFKGLGFNPVSVSEHYAAQAAKENVASAMADRKSKILADYAQAKLQNEDTTDAEEAAKAFNEDHPTQKINRSALVKAVAARKKGAKQLDESGVSFTKKQSSLKPITRFAGD